MKVNAKHMKMIHLGAAIFWALMGIPTVLWWGESVLWVGIMSIYAIVVGHIAGYQGARAERQGEKVNGNSDEGSTGSGV